MAKEIQKYISYRDAIEVVNKASHLYDGYIPPIRDVATRVINEIYKGLDATPPAEVKRVTWCKNCKYFSIPEKHELGNIGRKGCALTMRHGLSPYDSCDKGERKESNI